MIVVRRADDRSTTEGEGVRTRHSFSFGAHYDPTDVGHALLVAHNDDRLAPGAGYAPHPHRDLEIVTWVLEGELVHRDSRGGGGVVRPGLVQRLSAGSGVVHSEHAGRSGGTSTRFVQMWVRPDESGTEPGYAQHDVGDELGSGDLVPVASGSGRAAVGLQAADATLLVARLDGTVALPDAAYLHLFVATGRVDLEGVGALDEADAARFSGEGSRRLTGRGEVLVWAFGPPSPSA